jgi:hypothetical protein
MRLCPDCNISPFDPHELYVIPGPSGIQSTGTAAKSGCPLVRERHCSFCAIIAFSRTYATRIKSATFSGTAAPCSALMSDLPEGDGARVKMVGCEVQGSAPAWGAMSFCLGPGCTTRDIPIAAAASRTRSAGVRRARRALAMSPKNPMSQRNCGWSPRIATARLAAHGQWDIAYILLASCDGFSPCRPLRRGRGERPPASRGSPISLKSTEAQISFPIAIDLCLTDRQLIRKVEL